MIKLPSVLTGNSNNRIYVGFNVGDTSCQISYSTGDGNVETVSTIVGAEEYSIPTVLCKRPGVNQWFYGKEALRYAQDEDGILVENLLSKAISGMPVEVDGISYQPVSLLSLFMKRCMSLVTTVYSDKMAGVLFTAEKMNYENMEVLKEAVAALKLKTDKIYFQSHMESYYHYMVNQQDDLWHVGSVLFEYESDEIIIYRMKANYKTEPVVVYISDESYPMDDLGRGSGDTGYELIQMDKTFLNIARSTCSAEKTVSVFLIGDKFSDRWMKESKKYLCSNYRVFQGSNLYSKGACYGLLDRLVPNLEKKDNIFLGNDKLTCNVGMNILHQGDQEYFAILDAGVSWYDASQTFDFYLQDGDYVDFHINSLIGGDSKIARITLEDFSGKLSRMRARLYMENEKKLVVEIEDLGLGNFRASTHKVWREEIPIR